MARDLNKIVGSDGRARHIYHRADMNNAPAVHWVRCVRQRTPQNRWLSYTSPDSPECGEHYFDPDDPHWPIVTCVICGAQVHADPLDLENQRW